MTFAAQPAPATESIEESSRQYPCPECAPRAPEERLAILRFHTEADSRYRDEPDFEKHVRYHAARGIADMLLEQGFIRLERGPVDVSKLSYRLRATVGVVAAAHVASLERRIAENQEALAREVMAEAEAGILVWDFHYTGVEGPIRKAHAVDAVRDALRHALDKRALMKVF